MRFSLRVLPGLWFAAAFLLPSEASAHLGLRRSDPDSSARLASAPTAITLWFTEGAQIGFSRTTRIGPDGNVAISPLASDTGNVIRAPIPPLTPGEYLVRWQTASADGHPIRGEFRFVILGASGSSAAHVDPVAAHVHEPTREAHTAHPLYRGVRWIEFVALLAVLGALGFRHLVLPAVASRGVSTAEAADRARRMGQSILFLYLPAALIRLYAESAAVHPEGPLEWASLRAMLETPWGIGWMIGFSGALVVLVGWRLGRARVRGATLLAIAGGILLAFSPALTGHAATGTPRAVSVAIDAAHVAAASLWLGGLLMMLIAGLPTLVKAADGSGHAAVAAMVNSFHPVALICAPLVLLTGMGNTWQRMGNPLTMLQSEYGRVLALKIGLFLVVAALGLYHSVRARRSLGTADATRRFRISAMAEVGIAAAILAATAILIVTPLPVLPQ